MDCVFNLSADGKMWLGVYCSHSTPVLGPKPPKRNCKNHKPLALCARLGEYQRTEECETCVGKTRIKVFACSLYGEATIAKKLDGIACCDKGKCADYSAARRDEADDGRSG